MTKRVLLGALGGGAYGLKVSKPGYDVTSIGLEDKQLSFNSSVSKTMRVLTRGSITVSSGSGVHTVSFGSALSALPLVFCLWRANGDDEWQAPFISGSWGNNNLQDQASLLKIYKDKIELLKSPIGARDFSYIVLRP